MKKILHSGASHLLPLFFVLALSVILPACSDDADRELPNTGKGGTVTLELSLSVPPIVETKAVICEADSGSEARKAGFYYEMQVQTTDTTGNAGKPIATKAASSLNNIYAFLFRMDNGKFNGRASIDGEVDITKSLMLKFEGVTSTSATGCRLVIIANDAEGANYTSSTNFANFSGTYTEFQNLMLTSDITKDEDIPYVGSTTVALDDGMFTALAPVSLYRMLAKITLTNNYAIGDGVLRNSIILYNAGNKYFDSGNGYDGSGTTQTAAGRYSSFAGKNEDSNIWYVGENVQSDSINAAYIEFQAAGEGTNTNPSVGEEYTISGYALRHKVYLSGYALKRNNVYNIKVNMSGSFDFHKNLPNSDPNVSYTELSSVVHGGLNIGMFGGAVEYTSGTGPAPNIKGSYTKYLLLQPNTSGTTGIDNVKAVWGNTGTRYQTETRKYWDYTYIKSITTGGLVGGMSVSSGSVYKYCYELTIGGVSKGTWYPPTYTQLQSIWTVFANMQNSYYSNFYKDRYVTSTEDDASDARGVSFSTGELAYCGRATAFRVRCVRDFSVSSLSAQVAIETSDGYPAIDLSALEPMGAVLSSVEAASRRTLMNQQTPSNSAFLQPVGSTVSDHNGTWNAKMSIKYQVMRANLGSTTDWTSAWNACKAYSGEGGAAGTWRLPTQRELMMIWILHPQLIEKGGFTAFVATYYWSATEYGATGAWNVNFGTGVVNDYSKTNAFRVRCVRDL